MSQKYFAIAVITMAPCLFFVLTMPESGGDGIVYILVANNILNGCGVSMSEVGVQECIPHFGGNQGPGYPAFIALVWSLSERSDLAVRLVQTVLYVISVVYLVDGLYRYTSSSKQALIIGLVLAISPLTVAWPRFILGETLALAGTLWVFAELLKSIHNNKLRLIPIGLALIMVTFIRLDAILLVVPISLAAFMIHNPTEGIKRILIIGLILALPWSGWLARNYLVGLDNIFKPVIAEQYEKTPGIFNWTSTWSTTQYSSNAVHYPVFTLAYDEIKIDKEAYSSSGEMETVLALLKELKNFKNKPFPKYIDNRFAELAKNRKTQDPFKSFFIVPLKRITNFWLNFNAGYGWPSLGNQISAQDRLSLASASVVEKLQLIKSYPLVVTGRIITQTWKLLLYLGFGISICLVLINSASRYKKLMVLILSFVLVRSYLAGYLNIVEARYSIMQMPVLELFVVLVLTETISNWRANKA